MKKIFMLCALCLLAFGCDEDRTPGNLYDGDDYVYFLPYRSSSGEFDWNDNTASWTWYGGGWETAIDHDVKFKVQPLGFMSDRARRVKIAVANVDADDFPADAALWEIRTGDEAVTVGADGTFEVVLPAGASFVPMAVRLKFDSDKLYDHVGDEWQIVLECRGNDDFEVWPETWDGVNGGEPLARFTVNFGVSEWYYF